MLWRRDYAAAADDDDDNITNKTSGLINNSQDNRLDPHAVTSTNHVCTSFFDYNTSLVLI